MPFSANTISAALTGAFTFGVFSDTYSANPSNDVEIVGLDLVAGRLYEIDGDGTGGDAYVRIFDSFGNEVKAIDDDFDSGEASTLDFYTQFIPNFTGVHYFAVSNVYLTEYDPNTTSGRPTVENPGAFASGSLVVTDTGVNAFPSNGSINAITTKSSGDESDLVQNENGQLRVQYGQNTSLSSFDVEMGRFDLTKGDTVVIDINGQVNAANVLDSVLRIFDDTGAQIGIDIGSGNGADSELIFIAPNTDDFYIGVSGTGNTTYDATTGSGTLAGDSGEFQVIIHRNANLVGTSSANIISGLDNPDYVVGLAGADTLSGNAGNDTLAGGDDNDRLTGSDGEDQLFGEFNNDSLDGGRGTDLLSGGDGNDTLLGGINRIEDILQGDAGNDSLDGGRGDDTLDGGAGNDTLLDIDGDNLLQGGAGQDSITGGGEADTVDGGNDADTIVGDSGDDSLGGGNGNDTIQGNGDDDILAGGGGDDSLAGGGGLDTLRGGLGADTLTGNADADQFDFDAVAEGVDTITDFATGTDLIDLRTLFGAGVVNAGNLSQFVQTSNSGAADSFLGVDQNGLAGGLTFTIIAQVNGVTAAQLFDIDNFLL